MPKPTLIYDGDCRFCRQWVERWKAATGERVDYLSSDVAVKVHPGIRAEDCDEAIQWMGADGGRLAGAPAVFAALAEGTRSGRFFQSAYGRSKPFARAADALYRLVARRRQAFSVATRWLWGNDVLPPEYAISTRWFLRLLAAIYLIAFVSYGLQLDGLIGEKGILPAQDFFRQVREFYGPEVVWRLPSLGWLGAGSGALHAWCWSGVAVACLLLLGFAPLPCLLFLWLDYLSLTVAGQVFYQFQWDILLLEAGFLAILIAPRGWRPKIVASPPRLAHFLLLWLLFRLMFSSGVVKLTSGDPSWADGTALTYHYFTQPLPTPLAWYAQQLPRWWQFLSVKIMFAIELGAPFFLFCPRRLRLLAAGALTFLQILIALTGNYGFFNLLTLALILLAVDDSTWWKFSLLPRLPAGPGPRFLPLGLIAPVAVVILLLSLVPLASAFRRPMPWLAPLAGLYEVVAPFRTINGYGLFSVMTRERREILIEGSEDGVQWKPYRFRDKPGDVDRAPPWVAPYMPRLDWQMWFAALSSIEDNPWFVHLLARLLEPSPAVLGLLVDNPFPGKAPRYVRAMSDRYAFTTFAQRDKTGAWWTTEPAAIYCREVSLGDR